MEERLQTAAALVRDLRREYNTMLDRCVNGEHTEYNSEDLFRLVGTLEALYNHILAAMISDGGTYCIWKHLPYATILIGELNAPDLTKVYEIVAVLSDGKIEPCQSCKSDQQQGVSVLDGTL